MKLSFVATLFFAVLAPSLLGALQKGASEKKIPDYSMVARRDIPREFTWRVEDVYATPEEWKADKEALPKLISRVDEMAKDWTSSPQKMLAMLELTSEINRKSIKLLSYASFLKDTDMANSLYQMMQGEVQSILVQLNAKLAFFNPDVLALGSDKFAQFLKVEPGLEPYRFGIEDVLRTKDHILPADQQRIASLTGLFGGATANAATMLNNSEIPPVDITLSDGTKVTLNYANYVRYRGSKNAADRSLVMTSFWANQKKFENTLAILQDGAIKQHLFNAQIHQFKDSLEARLFGDNIDPEVYRQLIRSTRENLTPLHRYLELKKKLLGLEKFRYDDIYASAVASVDKLTTYDEATSLLLDVLKPLGKDYADALIAAFGNRWIDIYSNKDKESGAYSSGVYGVHPFIKLNYTGKYDTVSTLAHELGHALHSHFADKTQHFANSQYPTFLAEIASTFNENLLMDYLVKNEKDDLFKLTILDSYLDRVRGTMYRQTLFAEFELAMHQRVEQGQTLTPDWLNQKYLELTRAYYGHDKGVCDVGDYIQVEWNNISHFFLNYYVFQYSTGIIASMALAEAVINGGPAEQARYLELLKAGGSDYPIAILKKAGVDMTTPAPAAAAFKRFDKLVGEMEKIVERLKQQKKTLN